MFRAKMVRVEANAYGRDLAVGDVHGCFSVLERALDRVNFDPAVDRLFAVGDLVDRGPESHHVTTWLDRPWFRTVCGNHELMTLRSALGNPYPGVDHARHGGEWLKNLPLDEQERIAHRLLDLPLIIEVETPNGIVGLIHADCPCDNWNDLRAIDWHRCHDEDGTVETCLWSVARYRRKYTSKVRNVHAVVHGHMTVNSVETLGNVFFIDTGGWRPSKGRFTLLDLHTLKVVNG